MNMISRSNANLEKALFRFLFCIFISLSTVETFAVYTPVSASLVSDTSGNIIYSSNANLKTQPASLTKMMTLLLVFKALEQRKISFSTKIKISQNAASQSPCMLGLKCGEYISMRDAILALITKSANDIAVAIAEHIGKSEKKFVRMMNKEAKRLNMNSTTFQNPSGWKNPQQLTTAKDMAKLSKALICEYPGYYGLFSTKSFCYRKEVIKNHNNLLKKKGEDIVVDGIKTGFLNASGFNIAASAVRGKKRLIVIVLGGKTARERDIKAYLLIKKAFSKLLSQEILKSRVYHKKNAKKSIKTLISNQVDFSSTAALLSDKEIESKKNEQSTINSTK
ncbi:MAG: D-alanyl-D-alanine carboxypeptidase [Holosporaceae bacterium]|jgi:D-alanyl-D-alanine carboxypeptidase|nr:D-alanyl-D-alanine carboxypeptidase [Holosporaceae bacterium]